MVLFKVAAAEKPHPVLLKWDASVPKSGLTVVGYNIYRSGPDGNFAPVASVAVPTYLDSKVSSGMTYQYFVRAVDTTGHESPPSNQASATIP